MKKYSIFLSAFALTMAAEAQTLHVVTGDITYQFPAAQASEMTYDNGQTLTIMGKTFNLTDISKMYVDNTAVTDNLVSIAYNGTSANVTVAGNVAQYVAPQVSGAHVIIAQSNTDDVDGDEITYSLSGSSTDGEFYMSGSYKATIELNGVSLTNTTPVYSGAALHIQNGKRIDISVKKDTENTLKDCASPSTSLAQKSCLYVKGHAELKGKGTLYIYGKYNHGIKTGDYLSMKNCTVNILQSVGDGIHANEYFLMGSGTLSLSTVGDDGIQVELDGDTSTGVTTDHEDEDSGNIYISGGTITASITATAAKGIKASGDIYVTGGELTINTSGGGTYDSDEQDTKACAGISADGNITVSDGTLTLKSTGAGGKCLKCDGTLTISDNAVISATSTGSQYKYSSSLTSSPKAIKAGVRSGSNKNNYSYSGGVVIKGGTITASSTNHEAIESKSTINISGGYVYAAGGDDAINSASTFTISGGYVMGNSSGNDGMDANGNFNITGGTVFAIAARSPEVGIDANTEDGYKLSVTGGTIVAIGGLESGSTLSQTCYQASSYSKSTWYGLYSGSTLTLAFKVPSNSSMGTPMVVSTAGTASLKSGITTSGGTSIWNGYGTIGSSASGGSSVSLSTYSGGNSGPGGGGNPWGGR